MTSDIKERLQPLVADYAAARADDSDDERDVVRLTPEYAVPLHEVLSEDGIITAVRGPYGVGGGPSDSRDLPAGMRCGVCGYQYSSGARCVTCGIMDDGD